MGIIAPYLHSYHGYLAILQALNIYNNLKKRSNFRRETNPSTLPSDHQIHLSQHVDCRTFARWLWHVKRLLAHVSLKCFPMVSIFAGFVNKYPSITTFLSFNPDKTGTRNIEFQADRVSLTIWGINLYLQFTCYGRRCTFGHALGNREQVPKWGFIHRSLGTIDEGSKVQMQTDWIF